MNPDGFGPVLFDPKKKVGWLVNLHRGLSDLQIDFGLHGVPQNVTQEDLDEILHVQEIIEKMVIHIKKKYYEVAKS